MEGNYRHLTLEDRKMIEKLYKKMSRTQMADILGCSTSTMWREMNRCPDGEYNAAKAQTDYEIKVNRGNKARVEGKKAYAKENHKALVRVCLEIDPTMGDREIAKVTKLPVDEVKEIRKQPGRKKRKEMQTE